MPLFIVSQGFSACHRRCGRASDQASPLDIVYKQSISRIPAVRNLVRV